MPPLGERQSTREAQLDEQATTSADPVPVATSRTYTPVQDYQWLITKDFFSDLQERARNMYLYEREMYELSKLIPKEQFPRDSLQMDSARIRAKIEKDWADYEFQNPEQTRAGYTKPKTMYDKSLWDNQPAWRAKWMKKRSGTLKIYYESPREMRIDPTYCPTERRYTWAQFEKEQEKNPNLLNFPRVASPQSYLEINDEWMAELCETIISYYEGVPDFTIVMFCKFLRLIHILLTCFEKEKKVDPYYYKYNLGDQELAWDLNLFPLPQQVHGLYERVRFLQSPYIITFEEMMTTGFLKEYTSSCFGSMARLGETFVRRRLMDAELKYLPPDITDPEELKKQHDMFTVLRWNHTPMRREDTSLDTILQRINDMESTMLRTIRGGGRARRQRGMQPIRRPAVAPQPQPPPQPRQPDSHERCSCV